MVEEEARKRHRTERLAQLGTLLAGFAHEIRNPLSTIGLNLQLIKEDFADAETSRGKRTYKRLSVVEGEVKRLQTILEDFLSIARTPVPRRRPVDLNALLQRIVDFTEAEMRADNISLKFFPGSGIGDVSVDADQIRAVVVNLLRNAQDACESGDEILVSSRRAADEILVQVTDTGEGMAPDVLENAFTPYFSTKKGGTGLGLAMARRIVEDHGGSLNLSSEPGKGTQFTLCLPAPAAELGQQHGERS